jgi:thioredoxin 1
MPSAAISDQTFNTEVLQSPVPVIVHFWAPWCGLCHLVEPPIRQFMEESNLPCKLIGINADENLKLANNYRISTLPTILLFREGRLLNRLEQLPPRTELQTFLKELLLLPVMSG